MELSDSTKSSYLAGFLTMLLGQFCFSVNDSLVKWTVLKMPGNDNLFMVVFFRGTFMCFIIAIILAFQGKLHWGHILKPSALHGRGLIEVGLTFSFLTSILMLPITDVYTILLTAPLMITASGVIFFRERVGWREWLAVMTGFLGVMIVVWPDDMGWKLAYALPLFATVMIVFREVYTKRLPHHYSGLEIVLITGLLLTIAAGFASIPYWQTPDWSILFPILGATLAVTVAHVMTVLTVRLAPLSVTSPGRYSIIIFGAISAFIILQEIPSKGTIIGSIIVIGSGLFLLGLEKRKS